MPVPITDKNVPVTSLQLVGPRLSEAKLLNVGRLIESSQPKRIRQIAPSNSAQP
jgi:amidase